MIVKFGNMTGEFFSFRYLTEWQPDKVAIQSKQRKELSYNISKFHNSYDKNYNFLSGNLQPKWEWYMIEKNNKVKDNNERFKRDKSRN